MLIWWLKNWYLYKFLINILTEFLIWLSFIIFQFQRKSVDVYPFISFHTVIFPFLHALLFKVTISIFFFSFAFICLEYFFHFLPFLCFMFVVQDSKLLLSHYFFVINTALRILELVIIIIMDFLDIYYSWNKPISACWFCLFWKTIFLLRASWDRYWKELKKK